MDESAQTLQVTYKGAEITIDVLHKILQLAISSQMKSKPQTLQQGKQSMASLGQHEKELDVVNLNKTDLKPIPLVTLIHEEHSQIGKNFIKHFAASLLSRVML